MSMIGPRSHELTPPVHKHIAPTSSSRRRCMPSSTCPDMPGHERNDSAGADGHGTQRLVRTRGTRSPPRGTAMQQANIYIFIHHQDGTVEITDVELTPARLLLCHHLTSLLVPMD